MEVVERGVRRLRSLAPRLPIRARSTLHRHNFRDLPALIDKARASLAKAEELGLEVNPQFKADLAAAKGPPR